MQLVLKGDRVQQGQCVAGGGGGMEECYPVKHLSLCVLCPLLVSSHARAAAVSVQCVYFC